MRGIHQPNCVVAPATRQLRRVFRAALLSATIAAGLPLSAPAFAQDEPVTTRASAEGSEIFVIARKREEAYIDVPVIETVISEETIERAAITDINDIAKFAPGLQVGQNVLSTGTQISIRGYGTSASDPGVDQSVALSIDGFTFSQGLAFESGMFDLQQIEVLKGPQALFFGKSSPGGVIALRSADPGNELEVIARAGYEFEAREKRGELVVSTPIGAGAGVRLAGQVWDRDGFFYNRATALANTGARDPKERLGGGNGYQLRGTVLLDPSPAFDARLKVNYVHEFNEYSGTFQMASCPEGRAPRAGHPFPQTINPNDDCTLDRNVYLVDLSSAGFPTLITSDRPHYVDRDQIYGSLELNWRPVDALTLTSVTGYYDVDNENVGFNTFQTSFSGPTLGIRSFYDRQEFQQEFRVNSDLEGPINFTAGAFYQKADVVVRQETYANQVLTPTRPVFLAGTIHSLDIEAASVFGQLRFAPSDQFEIAIGGRYTNEQRGDRVVSATTGAPIAIRQPTISSRTFSPELTFTYEPSDDLTLFGSLKRGFKGGSYTLTRVPTTPGFVPDNSFGDEMIEGGELGLKSRLLDRQLTMNIAGFYYNIEGLQAGVTEADSIIGGDLPIARTLNAGGGYSYGVDFEAQFAPLAVEGLSLYAALNWNRTKFTDFDNVPCYGGQTIALGCNTQRNPLNGLFTGQDVGGKPFVRAPEWQGSFGAVYEMPVSNGWTLTLATDNSFSSSYYTSLGLRDDFIQDGYIKMGGSIAIKSPDDQWELALIGKNLNNEITSGYCGPSNYANSSNSSGATQITGGTTSGPDGIDEVACSVERGRSVWVRLTFKPFN
jgi:iron complex outermembrane recepter protein